MASGTAAGHVVARRRHGEGGGCAAHRVTAELRVPAGRVRAVLCSRAAAALEVGSRDRHGKQCPRDGGGDRSRRTRARTKGREEGVAEKAMRVRRRRRGGTGNRGRRKHRAPVHRNRNRMPGHPHEHLTQDDRVGGGRGHRGSRLENGSGGVRTVSGPPYVRRRPRPPRRARCRSRRRGRRRRRRETVAYRRPHVAP